MDRLKVCIFATEVPFSNLLLAPLLKGYYVVSRYRLSKTKRGMGTLGREMTRRQHHVPLIPEKDSHGSEGRHLQNFGDYESSYKVMLV